MFNLIDQKEYIEPSFVPPKGDLTSNIAFIGEAPGAEEEAKKEPFVGKPGTLLKRIMMNCGISPGQVYMTNVIKERPKDNKITPFFHKNKFTEKGLPYLDLLKQELQNVKSNVFVAVGKVALVALCGRSEILKNRGSILESTLLPGKKVIPIVHPSAALKQYLLRYMISWDIQKINTQSEFPEIKLPERNLIVNPTYHESLAWIDKFWTDKPSSVCIDIEITGQLELACLALSYNKDEAICFPITKYTLEQEAEIMVQVSKILMDSQISIVGQNVAFDLMFLIKKYHIHPRGQISDTMLAHHAMLHEIKKGLDTLCSLYTNEPYYKDEGKEWKNIKDWNMFWRYNAKDAAATLEIKEVLYPLLEKQGFMHTYKMDIEKHYPLFYAMLRGIRVDIDGINKVKDQLYKNINDLQIELDSTIEGKITNKELKIVDSETGTRGLLNVNSNPQMKAYFYEDLRIKPYKSKGKDSCDDKALVKLSKGTSNRPPLKEAKIIQELRKLKKFRSTYINMEFDDDNRFRCTLSPGGTYTGRLSSSKTIFHTGMNMQNLPLEFRHFLMADKGYLLLELDGIQAEWVATAFISGDVEMMRIINEGKDPHTMTAHFMTGMDPDFINYEDKYIGHIVDPEVVNLKRIELSEKEPAFLKQYQLARFVPRSMTARQAGKKSNHGFNYGLSAHGFSDHNEIPLAESITMHNIYHQMYPSLGLWHRSLQHDLTKDRTLINPFGRKVRFLDRWGPSLFNAAYAFLPQSTNADNINRTIVDCYKMQYGNQEERTKSRYGELLGQVHDSILYQFPYTTQGIDAFADFTLLVKNLLERPIQYKTREFRICAEASVGFNWGSMKNIRIDNHDTFIQDIKQFLLSTNPDIK